MQFTEAKLEAAIVQLMAEQGYRHTLGSAQAVSDVLIQDDLTAYLRERYAEDGITDAEIAHIGHRLSYLPASDLYESNKTVMGWVMNGMTIQREDRSQPDLFIQLVDYGCAAIQDTPHHTAAETSDGNRYRLITQQPIAGAELGQVRIPDAILYINGLPLVVFEFKSTIRVAATLADAHRQLTVRYRRDIPELLKYNALCVISDGVNSKMGSLFAAYEFFYAWRKVTGAEKLDAEGIGSLYTMIAGLFAKPRLLSVIEHFIYLPDTSVSEQKIVCRYPQFYAASRLFANIQHEMKHLDADGTVHGSGKGGTYFGATGCGKSYTMLFLSRLLMRAVNLASPTLVLITDRTDLDDQLSGQFLGAKGYIGDEHIVSVESRAELKTELLGRSSGGVFLTTIHKFTEGLDVLTERCNVICISDEAHRSQTNLEQKVTVTDTGIKTSYGFAKYLHDSLPNATYVGFTGTPVDATLAVFGPIVDSYTMTESVHDDITVPIVYEGRAAKVLLDARQLEEVESYYDAAAEAGASEYQIEASKRAMASMATILGDPDRLRAIAEDFVTHYERRVSEGTTQKGKALFVCSNRHNAYLLYQQIITLRPQWAEVKACEDGATLTPSEQKRIKPMPRVQIIMTRSQDDPKALWDMLGNKDDRKELDRQFKNGKSNFKIAIVVDMWLTGFDVPFLDTIYIDKPLQKHSLIQTISRVNRKFAGKERGLVVDYIGIKQQMNLALAHYTAGQEQNLDDIAASVVVVKDQLNLLDGLFYPFDTLPYFTGEPAAQLACLTGAADFVLATKQSETRFVDIVKRLKSAYDICVGSDELSDTHRNKIHFYLAVRGIVFKLTRGDAPDTAQMNARVQALVKDALISDGVEEIFRLGESQDGVIDLFDTDYLAKLEQIKQPNTKAELLKQLLAKAIGELKKTNKAKGVDFSKQMNALVSRYNERKENDVLDAQVINEFSERLIDLIHRVKTERDSFNELGIDIAEKAFYDILLLLARKYDFRYPEDKLIELAKAVKLLVDDKAKYTDWNQREDIKADLHFAIIVLLDEWGYPPVDRDEVYQEIFEQAENLKRHQTA